MSTDNIRATLVSSGVHLGAVRRLGSSYSPSEYLAAVQAARDAGDGEAYATAVLNPEIVTATEEADPTGAKLHEAAIKILAAKGKADSYTAREYVDACSEAALS